MSEIYYPSHVRDARRLLDAARRRALRLVTAESCTGGLIAGLLTEIPGSSDIFDRGFVSYSNRSKHEMLEVSSALIETRGAVSREVAEAMATGALEQADNRVSIAVTGIAGPGGGSASKPVGLVWFATAGAGKEVHAEERRFGDIGRSAVRIETIAVALTLLTRHIDA